MFPYADGVSMGTMKTRGSIGLRLAVLGGVAVVAVLVAVMLAGGGSSSTSGGGSGKAVTSARYVRTGKVRLELRLLRFIGPGSDRLGRVAVAAAGQNRMWQFVSLAYARQGRENSGYANKAFINKLA